MYVGQAADSSRNLLILMKDVLTRSGVVVQVNEYEKLDMEIPPKRSEAIQGIAVASEEIEYDGNDPLREDAVRCT